MSGRETEDTAAARADADADAGATALRDLPCGEIRAGYAGSDVTLAGWVHRRRNLGGLMFVDLRDRSGLVQLSFGPDWTEPESLDLVHDLNPEDVLQVRGEVVRRPEEAVNPEMPTGRVEVHAEAVTRLSTSEPLPILVAVPPGEDLPAEEHRLRHRCLDLRRPEMLANFRVRHQAVAAGRRVLDGMGFLEVETPYLTRRTPEGARDYLVPSRVHRGKFFALPQSPQIYKQLLMVSGFDRYYQLARCLRDEDLRADRQPEFTQIDVEMSFVDEADVRRVCERMMAAMWEAGTGQRLRLPLPVLTHAEAVERYGTDKPDLRIAWEIRDLSEVLTGVGFRIFDGAVDAGGRVRGVVATGGAELSRSRIDALDAEAREHGAKGVLWLKRTERGWSGPPASVVDEEVATGLREVAGVEVGDLLLLVAGPDRESGPALDAVRRSAAGELGAVEEGDRFLWVVEFPLFERDPDTGRPVPSHHPFTMPVTDDPEEIRASPLEVRSRAYDVVYNGTEVCSGSIRCHRMDLQRAIFATLGLSAEEIEEKFGFMLEAFRYGVPPHGGYAVGLDRLIALMVGEDSIREVMAFPKTAAARGLMEGAPSRVSPEDLEELGLRIVR